MILDLGDLVTGGKMQQIGPDPALLKRTGFPKHVVLSPMTSRVVWERVCLDPAGSPVITQ